MNTTDKITELFKEHSNELLRLSYLYLKDIQHAEDAVSETFLKAYQNYGKFRGDSSEKTWLTKIAINTCKNIQRSKSYKETSLSETLPAKFSHRATENRVCVSSEIMKLPVKYREVVLLYYYRELTTKEIAKLLKIPRTTVDYRLRYAKDLLKQTLKEDFFNED